MSLRASRVGPFSLTWRRSELSTRFQLRGASTRLIVINSECGQNPKLWGKRERSWLRCLHAKCHVYVCLYVYIYVYIMYLSLSLSPSLYICIEREFKRYPHTLFRLFRTRYSTIHSPTVRPETAKSPDQKPSLAGIGGCDAFGVLHLLAASQRVYGELQKVGTLV